MYFIFKELNNTSQTLFNHFSFIYICLLFSRTFLIHSLLGIHYNMNFLKFQNLQSYGLLLFIYNKIRQTIADGQSLSIRALLNVLFCM
jgi:hypothetical protein